MMRPWMMLIGLLLAIPAAALQTHEVEIGREGVYDGQVLIERDGQGRLLLRDSELTSPVTLGELRFGADSAHWLLQGLDRDDHPHYLTQERGRAAISAQPPLMYDPAAGALSLPMLPVDRGGTGAAGPFAEGSLIFAGAGGVYSHDAFNLRWDAPAGRLGLGTAAPTSTLHVRGPNSTAGGITLGSSVGTLDSRLHIFASGSSTAELRKAAPGAQINFSNSAGASELHLAADGKVGIGTASPTHPLHVSAGGAGVDDLYLALSVTGGNLGDNAGIRMLSGLTTSIGAIRAFVESSYLSNMRFYTAGAANVLSEAMRITSSQLVQVGTAGSASPLATGPGDLDVRGRAHVQESFRAGGSEGLAFDAGSRRLGIGTVDPQARLDVAGAARVRDRLDVEGEACLQGRLRLDPAQQVLTSIYDTIQPAAGLVALMPGSELWMGSTPTIAAGSEGQWLVLVNQNPDAAVQFYDEDFLTGSGLALGASSRVLEAGDVLMLLFVGGRWCEVSYGVNH